MNDAIVEIGIAVVLRKRRVLVGIRSADGPLPNKHEFPGGKCWPGESSSDCAVRECLEETGLTVEASRLLQSTTHMYAHATVRLHFWECTVAVHSAPAPNSPFDWIPLSHLAALNWPAANAPSVQLLVDRDSQSVEKQPALQSPENGHDGVG